MGILIVDDDASIREALASLLEDEGYTAAGVANGLQALTLLRQSEELPCLILLDLMMPVMNGWEFLNEQQQELRLAEIAVVVFSAHHTAQHTASLSGVKH